MPEPVTRRRVVLGIAVGAASVGVAGCTTGDDGEPTQPPVDADTQLVQGIAGAIAAQHVMVHSAIKRLPAMKRELIALRRVHAAHLDALGGYEDVVVTRNRPDARAEIIRGEERLQRQLANAAVEAGSGSLAKLLASMSAAIAQQLVVIR